MNKRFMVSLLAIFAIFAILGCSGPSDPIIPEPVIVTVSFDPDYSGSGNPLEFQLVENEALGSTRYAQVTALEEARDGHDFKGWSLTRGGAAVTVNASSSWDVDTDYYGLWEEEVPPGNPITLTYVLNDFPIDGVPPEPFQAVSGEAIGDDALPVLTATEDEVEFFGWSVTLYGEVIDGTAVFTSNTTLYAQYHDPDIIIITYDMNNVPGAAPFPERLVKGTAVGEDKLPEITNGGYIWMGWSLMPNGRAVLPTETFARPAHATREVLNVDYEAIDTTNKVTLYARAAQIVTPMPMSAIPAKENYDLHPLRTPLPSDWVRGVDISNCLEIEEWGGNFRDINGQIDDIMKILTDAGVNYVRIRLWHEPDLAATHYRGDGRNDMRVSKMIAVRAKAAGMKFLLNYHYSDHWADPGNQNVPYAWKDFSRQEIYDALYDFTYDTIMEFHEAGATPDMVAIGNEIHNGVLRDHGRYPIGTVASGQRLGNWTQYIEALDYASQATRAAEEEIGEKILVQVHFADGGDANRRTQYAQFTPRADTGAAATVKEIDYDVIGLSWYTIWPSHGNIDALYNNIRLMKEWFDKPVMVVETGHMWDISNYDQAGNYAGSNQEDSGANAITNTNGFAFDSGVTTSFRANGTTRFLPSTIEGQARLTRMAMDAIAAAGGDGIMWWGADWIAIRQIPQISSNSEMAAVFRSSENFNESGTALPALYVMGLLQGSDVMRPGKVSHVTSTWSRLTENVTVSWNAVHEDVASKYELQRSTSSTGGWVTLDDDLTPPASTTATGQATYTDETAALNSQYYYRIRAYNDNGWGNWSDVADVATPAFALEAPQNLRLTASTGVSANLAWNAVLDAASYIVYGVVSDTEPVSDDDYNQIATRTAAQLTYSHADLTVNDSWWYKVRAVYPTDFGEGPLSTALNVVLQPEVPANLRVTLPTSVSTGLAWNTVTGAESYTLYAAESATEPEDSAYIELVNQTTNTYNHTDLTLGETWWYKISATYASLVEGPRSTALSVTVVPVAARLRITDTTASSINLAWVPIPGATGYELYGAQGAAAPETDAGYILLEETDGIDYEHTGLTGGATWWYKVNTVFPTGNGPNSNVVRGVAEAVDLKSTVLMTTGLLDADFLDAAKASTSSSTNITGRYAIPTTYVVNNADNLYVAMDFTGRERPWGGYERDRIVVWVQNTSSTEAGQANTGTSGIMATASRISTVQNLAPGSAVHGFASKIFNSNTIGGNGAAGTRAINFSTSWAQSTGWYYDRPILTPEENDGDVLKFRIALGNIASAVKGDELRIFIGFSVGNQTGPYGTSGFLPAAAASGNGVSMNIDMANALYYQVK